VRHELSDYEWTAIKPMLPNKSRGVRRVSGRRVLKGIFWVPPFKCAMARSARKPLRVGRKIGFVLQKTR
jgi:transposase